MKLTLQTDKTQLALQEELRQAIHSVTRSEQDMQVVTLEADQAKAELLQAKDQ
jgi:hypothetical protein